METLWLVNGQRTGVDPADRGLAYGDGLFETMAARDGQIRWLDLHLDRLEEGCRRLEIPPPERHVLTNEIANHRTRGGRAVVKVIVTRGPGTRGYAPPATPVPTRIVSIGAWPDYPNSHYANGIRVCVCRLRLATNPVLAGVKHLNRLEHVLAHLELRGTNAEQGLLLDTSEHVVGGTSSNVFAIQRGQLLTPAIERAGIKGVMRRVVLAAAAEIGLQTAERDLTLAEVANADELFMTNALFGIWPVAVFENRTLAPGPVTRKLMQHLRVGSDA
ncbi:MAG: aminodeoxychorismate lyase [Gammaproteobacteria bacterium]